MTCQEMADILCDYIAGELAKEHCAQIRSHLDACPECVIFVETYQLTIQITRRLPAEPLSAEMLERLQRALDEQS